MITTCLVDGHAHFHECFDWQIGLRSASLHLGRSRRQLGLPDESVGVLLLARSAAEAEFTAFGERFASLESGWQVEPGTDDLTIHLTHRHDNSSLFLIDGRQVRTRSGLEVLGLAGKCEVPDGGDLEPTVRSVYASGAITVIPWGFGKWTGRRRVAVEDTLLGGLEMALFLGDNAGRPRLLPEPRLFARARAQGVMVLPGSDPLPIAGEERTLGRFGFVLERFDTADPAASIRHAVSILRVQPRVFGEREGILRTIYRQALVQAKRARHSASRSRGA